MESRNLDQLVEQQITKLFFLWEYVYAWKLTFQFCGPPWVTGTPFKAKDIDTTCKKQTAMNSCSCYGTGERFILNEALEIKEKSMHKE